MRENSASSGSSPRASNVALMFSGRSEIKSQDSLLRDEWTWNRAWKYTAAQASARGIPCSSALSLILDITSSSDSVTLRVTSSASSGVSSLKWRRASSYSLSTVLCGAEYEPSLIVNSWISLKALSFSFLISLEVSKKFSVARLPNFKWLWPPNKYSILYLMSKISSTSSKALSRRN